MGFDLQFVAQTLGGLLQGFGGHEGVGYTGRARGDGDEAWRARRISNRFCRAGDVNLSLFSTTTQHRLDILQCLRRSNLENPFADKTRHIDRACGDQQNPLRRCNGRRRQLAFRVRRIDHFHAGAPALTLRRRIKQTRAQHTGDHAVRASRNNG
ncbi:hypothetical protein D3C72_991730 [compost metagenome]